MPGGGSLGGSAGAAASPSAGASGNPGCTPDPAGVLSVVGDTVHDAKTCLDWMKTTKTGVNYDASEMFCGDAALGGSNW